MRLSDERLKEIMTECDKYELALAHDPTVLGPAYLQDLIARCRNNTNHVVTLLNEVRRSKMALDMGVRRKRAAFKIAADEYLAKNAVVRTLPNIKDREAQINLMLKAEHREIIDIENDILDLDHVVEVVKLRHRELKDTMREIQTQRALIRDDRETGSAYGDERPGMGVEDADPHSAYEPGARTRAEKRDEAEIEKMILDGFGGGEEKTETKAEEPVVEVQTVVVDEPEKPSTEPMIEVVSVADVPSAASTASVVEATPPKTEEDEILDFLGQESSPASDDSSGPPPVQIEDDLSDLIANL